MYNNFASGGAIGTAGTLAATGMDVLSVGWMVVAGITFVFAGLAIRNIAPKRQRAK